MAQILCSECLITRSELASNSAEVTAANRGCGLGGGRESKGAGHAVLQSAAEIFIIISRSVSEFRTPWWTSLKTQYMSM